jgi:hypothetical protein
VLVLTRWPRIHDGDPRGGAGARYLGPGTATGRVPGPRTTRGPNRQNRVVWAGSMRSRTAHLQIGHTLRLPAALTQAARRIVVSSEQSRTDTALQTMPVSQAVVYLVDHQEVVTAAELQVRLAKIGRKVPLPTVTASLHRARERGQLVSPARGRFSRPGSSDPAPAKGAGAHDG